MDLAEGQIVRYLTREAHDLLKGYEVGRSGHCFGDAIFGNVEAGHNVVHGSMKVPRYGHTINNHAWNADPGTGHVTDRNLGIRGQTAEELKGKGVHYESHHTYTQREAFHLLTGTGNHGPWTGEERARHKPRTDK